MSRRRLPAVALAVASIVFAGLLDCGLAEATGGNASYVAGTPTVDGVLDGPWNTSQGDPTAGAAYSPADLFPTFTPGGATTDGTTPNLAVYPTGSATATTPFPSGVAGTPGPLTGYCVPGYPNDEAGSPVSQPTGLDLPFAPAYFPDVVRNADGSLTGYFDYRPKDADEAILVARSTDNGQTWTTEGTARDQNGGYCPTADTNDDGQGHPFVMSAGGQTSLYTLQRPAGDNTGIGLLVNPVNPTHTNPLDDVPANQPVGLDPNTFATSAVSVPTSGGVSIPVSTLGDGAGSPEQVVAGPYEDLNSPSPSTSIVTCTGTSTLSLTGCTVAGSNPLPVNSGDDLVQVIATANPGTGKTFTVPYGPNNPGGTGGLATLNIANATSVSPITTYLINVNAPNRFYIDGDTVYCVQSNANPTNKIENCTTTNPNGLTVQPGDAITMDPILPPGSTMTTGLQAPDGIVGTIPSYPGAPSNSTVILYTEKILSYFIVGTTNAKVTLPATTINYQPSVTASEPLPASGSFTVSLGTAVGQPIQQVTCTGWSPASSPANSVNLTGCSGGTGTVASGNWVGGPDAATVPYSVLSQIGEGTNGSSKGPEKLFGNNEDLTLLRAAYTTDGVNFTDLGPISGSTSGTGNDSGSYDDVSNPFQTASPSATAPSNLAPGSPDTIELRYVGSRGTIITNPDGSYGMFLSGAWASDGDSDAFNQIFYTSSTDGEHWSTPQVVLSTDYSFAASAAQDTELAAGQDDPLGISAYYSGRAYGPAVVQNPNGTLTMVFSGYRLPKPITSAGTVLGTNSADPYTVGATDPALYRNILTVTLQSSTSPAVPTSSALSSSGSPEPYGTAVTYTDAVSPVAPGTGTPTGTVSFSDGTSPIAGCQSIALDGGSPDVATCTTTPAAGSHPVTATYSGDSNYAASTGNLTQQISQAKTTSSLSVPTTLVPAGASVTLTDTVSPGPPDTTPPTGTVSFTDNGSPIAGCQSVALSGGSPDVASCTTTPVSGPHAVSAVYGGDANDTPTTATGNYTVAAAPTKLTASSVLASLLGGGLSATLTRTDTSAPVAGQTIVFSIHGKTICTVTTNAKGTATCSSVLALLAATLNLGYDASYAGTVNFAAASATAKLV